MQIGEALLKKIFFIFSAETILVFMWADSWMRGWDFESKHQMVDGNLWHMFVCCVMWLGILCLKRPKNDTLTVSFS